MILGISSFAYGWSVGVRGSMPRRPLDEQGLIGQAIALGVSCVQFGDNLPVHSLPDERKKKLLERARQAGIRLEIGARGLTPESLQQYLECSTCFGSPLLRYVVDDDGYEPEIPAIISILKNVAGELKERKIRLGIENHDRFKARELAHIVETCSSDYIGICLDTVNSIGAGEGLEFITEILAPYTFNLHIKDFKARRPEHKMGFTVTGVPAGSGSIDIHWLLEKLSPFQRCTSAVLEQWVPPEQTIDATVSRELQWAKESIGYLQRLEAFRKE